MRIRTLFALLPLFAVVATGQGPPAPLPSAYRIHKLTLVSTDLPGTERDRIVQAFQGGTYKMEELGVRVRYELRNSGYGLAEVGDPQITSVPAAQSTSDADVQFEVHAGAQYRLGGVTFNDDPGNPVFPYAQLRAQFPLQDGAVFKATVIGGVLENLKDLYGSAGYANLGVIPMLQYDTDSHTVTVTIDIDQGRPVNFGKLLREGTAPRAGAAQQLLASWKELEGKRYNVELLREWLKNNSAEQVYTLRVASPDPGTLNVLVHFQ